MQIHPLSVIHKVSEPENEASLIDFCNLYLQFVVGNSSPSTLSAKQRDLKLFLSFANSLSIDDKVQRWTPSFSKSFQEEMLSRYSAATAERTMSTLKHFSRWLCERIPMPVGNPMKGVSSIKLEEPAWNGLSKKDLMQLRSAVDIRLASCKRRDQNPHLEAAVFYLLLNTGLRESELVNLNFEQYSEGRALLNVRRKGKRITKKVHIPKNAASYLDSYLKDSDRITGEPLFKSRGGLRLSRIDVINICKRIAALTPNRIKLTPHMLRHTFLKRVTDCHGVHVAQKLSGNVSVKEIFRYAKPSEDEVNEVVEGLF